MVVAVLVLATGFFVAAEFAVVAADRSRLDALAAQGDRRARAALAVHRRLSFHLSGAQLGISIVSLALGLVAEPAIAKVIDPLLPFSEGTNRAVSVGLALTIATVLSMVVGELIPKNLVLAAPERSALRLAGPLRAVNALMNPAIRLADGAASWIVRRLGVEPREELAGARSLDELALLIRASEESGTLDEERAELLERTIRFGEKTAEEAMVPRTRVTWIPVESTLADLVARSRQTGHSRFPVVGTDLDDLVGVVHVKDVFRTPRPEWATTPVTAAMVQPLVVPPTLELEDVLTRLRGERSHLAVVVDEHGGTDGVVTLEDVLEEIVGEIHDEHDAPTTAARYEPGRGSWVLPGTLHADEVRAACGFAVPEGEYETLAGFLLDRLGHLPAPGEQVTERGWTFAVLTLDGHRIASVRATPHADAP